MPDNNKAKTSFPFIEIHIVDRLNTYLTKTHILNKEDANPMQVTLLDSEKVGKGHKTLFN